MTLPNSTEDRERQKFEDVNNKVATRIVLHNSNGAVNDDNPLYNNSNGVVSSDNSSTTALNDSDVFTGTWEDVSKYNSLIVSVLTDQNGIYTIQFSPDGTNIDSILTRYYKTSEINVPHRFTITRKYFRVVFTNNSGSNQTYFRLQTLFGDKEPLNIPSDGIISQDYDATVVRPTEARHEMSLDLRQGITVWNKFGYNQDVDTASSEVIWAPGGNFTILTTGSTLTITSSSTEDIASTGDGARTLIIYGVDGNRKSQTEVVNMNGTGNTVTTSTWLGINRVAVASAGDSQENEGNITITATTGGSTQAYLPSSQGVTQQLIYFTPINAKGLAEWLILSADKSSGGGNPIVDFYGYIYSPVSNCKYEVFRERLDTSIQTRVELKPNIPFVFTEGDVFWIEASTSANNTIVTGRFSLFQYKNIDG